jgi:hypothetical protein
MSSLTHTEVIPESSTECVVALLEKKQNWSKVAARQSSGHMKQMRVIMDYQLYHAD